MATTDVLIVGAGPTGLALACQLIRYGIDFVIIDSKETTTPHSKAIGVQARTLEIYEQIGLHEKLIYDFINSNGKEVRWKTELESFTQDDSCVTAKIKNSDGEIETIEAK